MKNKIKKFFGFCKKHTEVILTGIQVVLSLTMLGLLFGIIFSGAEEFLTVACLGCVAVGISLASEALEMYYHYKKYSKNKKEQE